MSVLSGSHAPIRLVFGGSFDPPHRGHFQMIDYVLREENVRSLDLVPAAVSPFKEHAPPTAGRDRVRMLELGLAACLENPVRARCRVRTMELKRPGPSYSVDTLAEIATEVAGDIVGLLIGSDTLDGLERWKDPRRILRSYPVWIFRRGEDDPGRVRDKCAQLSEKFPGPGFRLLANPPVHCSSTRVRADLAAALDVSDCLPAAILSYIADHRLYASEGEPVV